MLSTGKSYPTGHYTGAMEAIEIQTGSKPAASIIWLHGLGADGHDFEPIVPELKLAKPVRFVFPHAPVRPVTINQGMRMRAWYDIVQFGGGPDAAFGVRGGNRRYRGLSCAHRLTQNSARWRRSRFPATESCT